MYLCVSPHRQNDMYDTSYTALAGLKQETVGGQEKG